MREIIFRGKAVIDFEIEQVCEFWERKVLENGNWIQGDLIWNNGIPFIVHGVIEANDEYISLEWWMPVDPETVGQYTGLRDKNGRMIFEGDIIRTNGIDGILNWECYCDEETYDFSFYPIGHEYCSTHNGAFDEDEREIIGNIHDNPELLGGK